MSNRYASWKKIDYSRTAYTVPDEKERARKLKDSRKPISIVVPELFSILEALLTHFHKVFLSDIFFPYEGVGPEDTVGALLMQHVVQQQLLRSGAELQLNTMFSDGFCYGIAPMLVQWEEEWGMKVEKRPIVEPGLFGPVEIGYAEEPVEKIMWEGNRLINIDPYNYLPDPNVPGHEVQKGEFVGFMLPSDRMTLLNLERRTSDFFNCKYLKYVTGGSSLMETNSGRADRFNMTEHRTYGNYGTNPVDLFYIFVKLIPAEWKLGSSEYPEMWAFALANDRLVVKAEKLNLNHQNFPIVNNCPDYDGYSVCPISRMEILYPMHETVNWFISAHITNVLKTMHSTYLVDPYRVNIRDVQKSMSEPGGIFRMRRASWGQGVQGALEQLQQSDITRNHVNDAGYLSNKLEQISAAPSQIQGKFDNAPERRTAAEFRGTTDSAAARLGKTVNIVHAMVMRPLGLMLAAHTQQFMREETYVRVLGGYAQQLLNEYGLMPERDRVPVKPSDLDVNVDLMPIDGFLPTANDPQSMIQLFDLAYKDPRITMSLDTLRLYQSIARRLGEKNIDRFIVQTQSAQQIEQQLQAGNIVPMQQQGGTEQ